MSDYSITPMPRPHKGSTLRQIRARKRVAAQKRENTLGASSTPKLDPINPAHYHGDSIMRIIEEFKAGFCEGNIVKYVLRAKEKNGVEDLKKARWYLERLIATEEQNSAV